MYTASERLSGPTGFHIGFLGREGLIRSAYSQELLRPRSHMCRTCIWKKFGILFLLCNTCLLCYLYQPQNIFRNLRSRPKPEEGNGRQISRKITFARVPIHPFGLTSVLTNHPSQS